MYEALVEAGVELLVGLPGTQTLPLDRTVARRDDIGYLMARHEVSIPHVAWGYHESGGGLSADSGADERGRHPIHEIEPSTFDTVVKANVDVTEPSRLRESLSRAVETALSPPTGPVRIGGVCAILAERQGGFQ